MPAPGLPRLLLTSASTWLQTRLQRDDRGATAVEYALLIAGIAALVMGAIFLLGPAVAGMFTSVTSKLGG